MRARAACQILSFPLRTDNSDGRKSTDGVSKPTLGPDQERDWANTEGEGRGGLGGGLLCYAVSIFNQMDDGKSEKENMRKTGISTVKRRAKTKRIEIFCLFHSKGL